MIVARISQLRRLLPPLRHHFCEGAEFFTESRQFWRPPSAEPKLSAKSPEAVQELLLSYILEHCPKQHPQKTIECIDKYAQISWMMNLGPEKRRIIEKVAQQYRLKKLLEVGTYCGYSALVLSQCALQPDAKIVTLEINKKHADIARRIIAHSGVRNVTVLGENMYEAVSFLNQSGPFDLIFLDQQKEQYLPDLTFLQERNLIRTGAVVVADNILYPGAPEYLAYMREAASRKQYRSVMYHTYDGYTDIPDAVMVSQKVY